MTKHGPITSGYSTLFRGGETHLAGGLANILPSSLLMYRISIKLSRKSGMNSNLRLGLFFFAVRAPACDEEAYGGWGCV